MLRLVRHFGDRADSGKRCTVCDVCAPETCLVRRFRTPLAEEVQAMQTVVSMLRRRDGLSTGRLFREFHAVHGSYDRGAFEDLLGALGQARVVFLEDASFEKAGETIHYQPDDPPDAPRAGRRRRSAAAPIEISEADADPALVEQLRDWRGKVAREKRLPAYTVLHNRTIVAVAAAKPGDRDQLLRIPGIGPTTVKRYGAALLRIVAAPGKPDPK